MNARAFFLRVDVIRTVCRALLVLLLILFWFARSWSLGTAGVAFFAVGFVLTVIGSVLRAPKNDKMSEFISNERNSFELSVRKEHKSFRTGDYVTLYGFGTEKAFFARALGNRLIYPICLNMTFLRHGTGGTLIVGELSLWEKKKTTKMKYRFHQLTVSFVRMDGDAEILSVSLLDGEEEKLFFFVRDDHFWRAFLAYASQSCRVLENGLESDGAVA